MKLNIISTGSDLCHLCSDASETVEHLFFECLITWRLWMDCCACWDFYKCWSNKPASFMQTWCGVKLFGVEKKMWITLFYVINLVHMEH